MADQHYGAWFCGCGTSGVLNVRGFGTVVVTAKCPECKQGVELNVGDGENEPAEAQAKATDTKASARAT